MFCEESLGKVNAKHLELFWNRLVHKLYCLKVLITLEQAVKKRRIFMSKTSIKGADGVANWLGVVNFH